MAIRGVNLAEKEPWVHPDDTGHPEHEAYKKALAAGDTPDKPTTYYLGNITGEDRVRFNDDLASAPTMKNGGLFIASRNYEKMYELVRFGLKGWDNQLDANDKPVQFTTESVPGPGGGFREVVSKNCMALLPNFVLTELAEAIKAKNGMTDELAKKSDGASQLPSDLLSVLGGAPNAQTQTKENEDASSQPSEK